MCVCVCILPSPRACTRTLSSDKTTGGSGFVFFLVRIARVFSRQIATVEFRNVTTISVVVSLRFVSGETSIEHLLWITSV